MRHKYPEFRLVQQRKFPKETGIPRWGCRLLVQMGMPQFALHTPLSEEEILHLYDMLLKSDVIYIDEKGRLSIYDTTKVTKMTAEYMAPGKLYTQHMGDEATSYGRHDYRAVLYRTLRRGDHWQLADNTGWIVYNPGLKVKIGMRTKHYLKYACRGM